MGYATALDLGQKMDRWTALSVHLRANCYPPVPVEMMEPCMEAIDLVNDGYVMLSVDLPDGVSFRGKTTVKAYQIIESFHLEAFLNDEEDE